MFVTTSFTLWLADCSHKFSLQKLKEVLHIDISFAGEQLYKIKQISKEKAFYEHYTKKQREASKPIAGYVFDDGLITMDEDGDE